MFRSAEKPDDSAEILLMNASEACFAATDDQVTECLRARHTAISHDIRRITGIFMASLTEANNELIPQYTFGLSALRKKLGDGAAFTDPVMIERMIDRVHERFLHDNRQSILWRFNNVFTDNFRQPLDIADDQWLAARRHCLAYDTSAVIDMYGLVLKSGIQRENLLALFANATLNKSDGKKAVVDAINRLGATPDTAQIMGIRQRMYNINREKARWAHVDRASAAQKAAIARDGGLVTVWSDHAIHANSGLDIETRRIDSGDTNYTPPQTARLDQMVRTPN